MIDLDSLLLLKVISGSRAYGLATPQSDEDTRGICIPPKCALIGLTPFEQWQDEKSDHVVFGLTKFANLALEGNPNMIELLYTEDILYCHMLGQRLMENRQLFLSRKVAERFGHYAISQLKRLENHHRWWASPPKKPALEDFGGGLNAKGAAVFPSKEARMAFDKAGKDYGHFERWQRERNPARAALELQYGYDTKHAMHLCRLLRMGQEILASGQVLVKRPDADWLRQVRSGCFQFDELLEWARRAEMQLSDLRSGSPLPEDPDRGAAENLVMEIIEEFHWNQS